MNANLKLSDSGDEKRRGVSVRTRFEVFKRDEFTCRYCGRKTPLVVLQVDHVIPVAQGGGNEIENLVTSCWECNSGKSDKSLSDIAPVMDIEEQSVLILERERQLREYNAAKRQQREREDDEIVDLWNHWVSVRDELRISPRMKMPDDGLMRSWLRQAPLEDLKDYSDRAVRKNHGYDAIPYMCGILRKVTSRS